MPAAAALLGLGPANIGVPHKAGAVQETGFGLVL